MAATMQQDEETARSRVIPRVIRREIERTDCVPNRETFLECVGRMVREENTIIESHRARLLDIIMFKRVLMLTLLEDAMWLEDMKVHYGAKDEHELLRRMDVIPVEMALAQSILESGWGMSYAARVGKGLFGQIQSRGTHSVTVPWTPGPDRPQPFSSHRESVTAYFMNLNTHPAYAGFRMTREQTKDPLQLMNHMQRYSERGVAYIRHVQGMIISLQKGELK
jgi:Bax protein